MEPDRIVLHLRIIYTLIVIVALSTITSLSISLDMYINSYKWDSQDPLGNRKEDIDRSKRTHQDPPAMFQDASFPGMSVTNGPPTVDYNFCRRVISDCDLRRPGVRGIKGEKGEPGIDGKGVKGCKGDKGQKGQVGLEGKPGLRGIEGMPGLKGARGFRLPKGKKGISGQHGSKGLDGAKGTKGDTGRIGPKGDQGLRGAKGDLGEKGIKGDKGRRGTKGESGMKGSKGESGQRGPRGKRGEHGFKGDYFIPPKNDSCYCTYFVTTSTKAVDVETEKLETTSTTDQSTTTTIITTTTEPSTTTTSTTTSTTQTTPTTKILPMTKKSECYINMVGIPFFRRHAGPASGAWLHSSLKPKISWIAEGDNGQYLKEFRLENNFMKDIEDMRYDLGKFKYQGNNHVIYNGTMFCYHWEDQPTIVCYDLKLASIVMSLNIENSNYLGGDTLYKTGSSYFDLEIDDNGLWIIYSVKSDIDNIHVIHVFPGTLRQQSHITVPAKPKFYGNGFISCGVLYLIDSSEDQRSVISFAFDLFTKTIRPVNILFRNPYKSNSMINFKHDKNSRNSRIYAWDNGRQIDYQILFS